MDADGGGGGEEAIFRSPAEVIEWLKKEKAARCEAKKNCAEEPSSACVSERFGLLRTKGEFVIRGKHWSFCWRYRSCLDFE